MHFKNTEKEFTNLSRGGGGKVNNILRKVWDRRVSLFTKKYIYMILFSIVIYPYMYKKK